jgi:GT2 family glycosyltransferase
MTTGESISAVIPTLTDNPKTLESIPKSVSDIAVISEGNRSEARNIGAERTENPILVFMDDDIQFEKDFFWKQIDQTDPGTVTGLEDYTYGLLLTRFLIIHRDDFRRVGGFDANLNHFEDTEFSLRALANGIDINLVDREMVHHFEHESEGKGVIPTIKGMLYIFRKHPRYIPQIMSGNLNRIRELGILSAYRNVVKE